LGFGYWATCVVVVIVSDLTGEGAKNEIVVVPCWLCSEEGGFQLSDKAGKQLRYLVSVDG
jgi:hypothetical protein